MPKFELIIHETPLFHETHELHAVVVRARADVGVCVRCLVEAIEAATHVNTAEGVKHTRTFLHTTQQHQYWRQQHQPVVAKANTKFLKARLQRLAWFVRRLRRGAVQLNLPPGGSAA